MAPSQPNEQRLDPCRRERSWLTGAGVAAVAAGLAAGVGVAWVLGRLKLLYYYRVFGVDLDQLELGFGATLFESWFVVQNLLYFVLLGWVALQSRKAWVIVVALAYVPIPLAAHYAFALHEWAPAAWLIAYRHTLLKFVPFAVLLAVWLLHPDRRAALRSAAPGGRAGLTLFALVAISWAISSAKHFGSYDANLAMYRPNRHLSRVRLTGEAGGGTADESGAGPVLYLLATTAQSVIVWDHRGFRFGVSEIVRVRILPRGSVEGLELTRLFRVQPGAMYL